MPRTRSDRPLQLVFPVQRGIWSAIQNMCSSTGVPNGRLGLYPAGAGASIAGGVRLRSCLGHWSSSSPALPPCR